MFPTFFSDFLDFFVSSDRSTDSDAAIATFAANAAIATIGAIAAIGAIITIAAIAAIFGFLLSEHTSEVSLVIFFICHVLCKMCLKLPCHTLKKSQ